jgi:hypothetical protein
LRGLSFEEHLMAITVFDSHPKYESMVPFMRHSAGNETSLQFVMTLNLIKAGLDEMRSDLLSRFIEFWCQKNCQGKWRVEETSSHLTVCFDLPRDIVLFKISDEYDYFNEGHSQVVFTSPVAEYYSVA